MIDLDRILKGINEHDEESWETLYKACYPALCSYTESLVCDMEAAKNIVQDILIYIWHSNLSFKRSGELMSYIYKSLYNNSLIHLRNQKKKREILEKMRTEQEDHNEDYLFVKEELIRLLYLHIRDLPLMRRKILELSVQGFSSKEIGEKLGISINTVKVQKNRSIKFLRETLKRAKENLS